MDFSSPLGSDPSVVAENIGEQDITLNGTNTPEPVLASTANKEKVNKDLIDSSGSGYSFSSKPARSEFPPNSEESSLCMSDLEAIPELGSLVHVDSNISLGSWFGDLIPQKRKDRPSSASSSQHNEDNEIPSQETSPDEKQCNAEQSKISSRYFMSESQLVGMEQYAASPFGTPSRTLELSVRQPLPEDVQSAESVVLKPESCQYPTMEQGAPAGYPDAFTLEEEEEVGTALNFSDLGFQGALSLQQEVFGSEEFAEDAADILDLDEEIFEEEHKLMMISGDEEEITGSGFTTVAESQSEDPKMSIGTYMAARSGKMGNFGESQVSVERPSFGMKIRTPSPRKPYPLQRSESTYIADDKSLNSDGNTDSEKSSSEEQHDETMTEEHEIPQSTQDKVQGSKLNEPDKNDNSKTQDTTLEPSMLSLSEAILNMSTSVSNDDLARAIIEMSQKKKMEKMSKIEEKRHSCREEKPDCQPEEGSSSQLLEQTEETKQTRRRSKIPKSVSCTSPPKHVRMSYQRRQSESELRKSDTGGRNQRQTQNESRVGAKILENTISRPSSSKAQIQSNIAAQLSSKKDRPPPLRAVENVSCSKRSPKLSPDKKKDRTVIPLQPESQVQKTENIPVAKTTESQKSESDRFKTIYVSEEFEKMKNWNPIMQESFMQDAPEHDDIIEKSAASEHEEMQTFNSGRGSVFFPDEISTKYLLSSTRTDLSLTRGSLSRESIEQLHRKLRIRGVGNAYEQRENAASSPVEKIQDGENGTSEKPIDIHPEKKLAEDTTWKTKDPDPQKSLGPLSHSSPPDTTSLSRYSGEFQQMLPSMSFNEMATIQEHQFSHHDLEEEQEKNIPKLDVIKEEEAETTHDTTLSGQSTTSGDSQLTTEMTHPAQHSIPPHVPILHPPQHLYPAMQHVMYRGPSTFSSGTLPSSYISHLHYQRHLDGLYHTLPADYHVRGPTSVYPHSFGGYPISAAYSSQHLPHSTSTPMGYSLEQPSMASSTEMGLNHTTGTMHPQTGYHLTGMVHGPRSATIDGRFPSLPESCYHQPQYRSAEASISVPAELIFSGVRCVSLLSHAKLPLVNKTERWMQVELNIVSPAIDCCFSLEAQPLVGPRATKDVEISFSPKREGRFEALLEVVSFPVSSEGSMLQNVRSAPVMVNLKAVAEKAKAEFSGPENKQEINFGETLCDTAKYLPLRISNGGTADIPVCVVLCTKSQDRKCFAISDSSSMEWNDQDRRSLTILRTVVHPGDRGTTLWVHCRIPPKYCEASEPPKNLSAQVYMELDNSQKQSLDTVVLDSIPVEVTACVAKLHAPKNMQPLNFSCPKDGSQTHNLPVKNCGNVSTRVTFSLLEHTDVFFVSPQHALLTTGEHIHVSIRYKPTRFTPSTLTSTLIMKIEPNGTKYEVLINADCTEAQSDQSSRQSFPETHSPGLGEMPSLLTNKSHLCWGGVPVGHSSQQRVVLRTSNGARKPLPMRVMIKGDDAVCFQILREDDKDREELCSKQEIVMRAGQDKIIRILFGPTRCKMALAKLEIKAPFDQGPSTKFTIPLIGYGGKSDIKIEGLESLSNESGRTLNKFSAIVEADDAHLQTKFTLRNNSSRHAFVKAILYSDRECQVLHQNSMASCSPFQFVLPKHTSRTVTVTVQPNSAASRSSYSNNGRDLAACVCLWHGDEIARHLFKNALSKFGPSAVNKSLSETNPLRAVTFDGIFEGEGSHEPEEDLSLVKPQLGDVQVFYTAMKKSIIEVFGLKSSKSMLEMVEPGKKISQISAVNKEAGQNFDKSHQHYNRAQPHQSDDDDVSWQLSPEQVILSAPHLNGTAEPSKIKVINRSPKGLRFDVSWSGHYLTITPHNGRVDPESVLVMLISANPSLASRRDVLPWIGTVQVSTQDGRGTKQLRVQIRDGMALLDASVQHATPVPRVPLKAHFSDHPSLDSFSTPMTAAGLSRISTLANDARLNKIQLVSALVDFGQTPVKLSGRSHLEFTNVCPGSIRWLLTSFAPAYVKDIQTTGALYRSTYAAFVFSHTSGLLEPGARVRIPVSFNPMSEGSYSQFWDLEHHESADSAALSLNKILIQVIGQGVKSNLSAQPNANTGSSKAKEGHGIYVSDEEVVFPDVTVNQSTIMKIPVKNRSKDSHNVRFINVRPPFHITHQRHTIRPMSYACLPVTFKPTSRGEFEGTLVIQTEGTYSLSVKLLGRGV